MPNFGARWINPKPLEKGGQAQTYVVEDAENPGSPRRVAKILNNPKEDRKARFLQEIEVTETFEHPNVVRSLGKGETSNNRWPYFVMPYYEPGTLEENYNHLGTPLERLRVFLAICEGVNYAHGKGLIHRDLKPANIFVADVGVPIVGDFGLCYRADDDQDGRKTQTYEAVGARKYMPPEWREGRDENPHPTGDIYSLGKILYWMFEGRVYDGHEDDHAQDHPILTTRPVLQNQEPQSPQLWTLAYCTAHELVRRTVLRKAEDRIASVGALIDQVRSGIDRIENGGRVLDFNLPKRCLFCAKGTYQLPPNLPFPLREERRNPQQGFSGWSFQNLVEFVNAQLGFGSKRPGLIPIYLTCDACGNIQYFRLDLTSDKCGMEWNP
jgi:serine/threonine protein kinase